MARRFIHLNKYLYRATMLSRSVCFLMFTSLLSPATHGQTLVASADKMNIAYIGIDNPLTIVVEDHRCEDIQIFCPGATITRKDGCHYNIRAEKEAVLDIEIKVNTKTGLKRVGRKKMKVKFIPNSKVVFGRQVSGNMNAAKALQNKGLTIIPPDGLTPEQAHRITCFRFVWFPRLGDGVEIENDGPLFNERIMDILNRLRSGDNIGFESVTGARPDGSQTCLNSIRIQIN